MAEFPDFLNLQEMAKEVAEEAKKYITFKINDKEVTFDELFDELATILRRYNAMQVVRCGECGKFGSWTICPYYAWTGDYPDKDWFCANGERRDGESDD